MALLWHILITPLSNDALFKDPLSRADKLGRARSIWIPTFNSAPQLAIGTIIFDRAIIILNHILAIISLVYFLQYQFLALRPTLPDGNFLPLTRTHFAGSLSSRFLDMSICDGDTGPFGKILQTLVMFHRLHGASNALSSDMRIDLRVSHNAALGRVNEINCCLCCCLNSHLRCARWCCPCCRS